jgi:hypothetical protein
MTHCANTHYLNQYLAQLDREDRREHAIVSVAHGLTEASGDMDPARMENIVEAMSEVFDGGNAEILISAIQDAMVKQCGEKTERAMHKVGILFVGAIRGYWHEQAMKEAERQIDNASCGSCLDSGCPKCEGDY